MPLVELPDGNTLDIPDDATPEQLAAVRAKLTTLKASQPGMLESAWNTAKGIGADLVRGAGKTLSGLAEGAAAFNDAQRPSYGRRADDRKYNELTQAVETAIPTPQGDSTGRQYLRAGLEGIAGAAVTGFGAANLASGALSRIGEEGAKRLGRDNPITNFAGGVVGGVLGGGAVGLATRIRPQTASIAREAIEGLSDADLKAAQAYQAAQAAKGIDLDLSQAVHAVTGRENNLTNVRNYVAGRSQGNQLQEVLRNQPEQIGREGQLTVNNLPGEHFSAHQNANNVQETATERLKQAMEERSAAVKGLYAQAGDLPPDARSRLGAILNQYATQPGATDVLKARAKEMAQKLMGQDPALQQAVRDARDQLAQATTPAARAAAQAKLAQANSALNAAANAPLKALDVDTWIGELRGPWQGQPLKVAYPKEQGQVKGLAGALNKEFQQLSPEVRKAEATFKQITDSTIAPLKQGPVGTLSQPRGFSPETAAQVTKFEGLMNTGTDPNAKLSDIRVAIRELGKVNPDAAENAFKGWVSKKFTSAMDAPIEAGASSSNRDLAGRLYDTFFKSASTWQGVKDATAEMAKLRGLPQDDLLRGLENYKKLVFAASSMPPAKGGLSPQDIASQGGNSNLANAVRVFSFLPMNRAGEAIERSALGKTLKDFDRILTSPEGADMLIKLGRTPVMSKQAQTILGTWAGMESNSPGLPDGNTPY